MKKLSLHLILIGCMLLSARSARADSPVASLRVEGESLNIEGSLQVDMLEQTDAGNYLYGNYANFLVRGTVTVANHEDFAISSTLPDEDGSPVACVLNTMMSDAGLPDYLRPDRQSLALEVPAGGTVTLPFQFKYSGTIQEDKAYELTLQVFGHSLASLTFSPRYGTNTYWTPDGRVKPLPAEGMTLKIPAEAVAVDFRGNYNINGYYSVDAADANPNCLYYLDNMDYVPQGLDYDKMIVRDNAIRDFFVSDQHDYFCPMQFEARSALFYYTPCDLHPEEFQVGGAQEASGTVVLPFDVQQVQLTDVNYAPGFDAGFYGEAIKMCRYQGFYYDTFCFEPVRDDRLNAYEPYLIASVWPSHITFIAENVTIPATRAAVSNGTDVDFVGSTVERDLPLLSLVWNQQKKKFFINLQMLAIEKTRARSFTAIIKMNEHYARYFEDALGSIPGGAPADPRPGSGTIFYPEDIVMDFPIRIVDDNEDLTQVNTAEYNLSGAVPQRVYSLTGQYLGLAGLCSLKSGLYIVGGRKVLVK